jgi:acarbose 7IV-phosphotransferase
LKNVFVIGGVSYDMIIHLDEFPKPISQTIHQCKKAYEAVGSTGAGKAASLAKLGMNVTLQGVIGNDMYGEKIIKFSKENNISFMQTIDEKGTDRHVNMMNKDGNRISMFIVETSNEPEIDYSQFNEIIQDSEIIALNIINYCRNFIPLLKLHNKEIWCDLHDYEEGNEYHQDFIDAADYIFLSSDNLKNYKRFMRELIGKGKKLVVCTHGSKGVSALTSDLEWIELPAINTYENVDTNGAGDNFFAGFIYGFVHGKPIIDCLKYGTIAGGLCVASYEIANEQLTPDFIEKEMKKHYS